MGANSVPRRIAKRLLQPILDEDRYSWIQCAAKSWDIWRGTWSEPELDVVRAAVRPGDVAIDVGANFGLYAYHLSRGVGARGKVYSFEPVPFTYKTLRRVVRVLGIDGNVEVVPKGCSNEAATITFSVPLSPAGTLSAGMAFIGGRANDLPGKERFVRFTATREVTADVVRLDDWLPTLDDVALLKCDVEGAEPLVFRGAGKLLARHKPTLIVEICKYYLQGFGFSLGDLVDPLLALGYEIYSYDGARRRLVAITAAEIGEDDNYVFVHPERRSRLGALLPA